MKTIIKIEINVYIKSIFLKYLIYRKKERKIAF